MDGSAQAECISANALQGCLAPLQAGNARGRRIEPGDLLGDGLWVQSHLNKLLIPMILQRAITRGKVHDTPTIAKDLHFPVQRSRQVQLQQNTFARVGGARGYTHLRPHLGEGITNALLGLWTLEHVSSEHPLAFAPASCRVLEADGIARGALRHI
jgi:hypothetical protein